MEPRGLLAIYDLGSFGAHTSAEFWTWSVSALDFECEHFGLGV